MKNKPPQIKIAVRTADALEFRADVLVIKHAGGFFGLDLAISKRFEELQGTAYALQVPEGETKFLTSKGVVKADSILVVGIRKLFSFSYGDIRMLAYNALKALAVKAPNTCHIAMTLHGVELGLDTIEVFESEVAGILNAIQKGSFPKALSTISIVELDARRAKQITNTLNTLLPGGFVETNPQDFLTQISSETTSLLYTAGYRSETKPHIFVAMPFQKDMDDVYYFGIEGPVRSAGFLCERADLAAYTGDILTWIKNRILTADLLVADLTTANPNVYLEVGYAWAAEVPTILLTKSTNDLKFDVRGQHCLVYDRIKDLEETLKKQLEIFKNNYGTEKASSINKINKSNYTTVFKDMIKEVLNILPDIKTTAENCKYFLGMKRVKKEHILSDLDRILKNVERLDSLLVNFYRSL